MRSDIVGAAMELTHDRDRPGRTWVLSFPETETVDTRIWALLTLPWSAVALFGALALEAGGCWPRRGCRDFCGLNQDTSGALSATERVDTHRGAFRGLVAARTGRDATRERRPSATRRDASSATVPEQAAVLQ
jgi:hypothetical protein